ncbi:MAG: ABC transporter ATP-binding protein [Thermoanaerobaculia bacterium]
MAPFLTVHRLSKRFGDRTVLNEISFDVDRGEILVLLGPSGSGKTTLLRLIAGFESPDGGSLRVAGEDVTPRAPNRRNFGMVFQHYALFPHLSVGENVAFGLEARKMKPEAIRARVAELLPLVDLEGFDERRVHQISGGQQQRVALARALAPDPRLLLLDEPLSNLDPTLRERTRRQLKQALRRVGITAVWVTHEQEEAFDVGERVALLAGGRLEQIGTPEQLYLEPQTPFVAGFVGRASFLPGTLGENGQVRLGGERFRGQGVRWPGAAVGKVEPGAPVDLVVRPEGLELVEPGAGEALVGEIIGRRYAGEATYYRVRLEIGVEVEVAGRMDAGRTGERAAVALRREGPLPRIFSRSEGAEA